MPDLKLAFEISDAFGPSGFEHDVAALIEKEAASFSPKRDGMQNVYTSLPQNTGNRPIVMLDAHMDEVGFMVQSILPNGLLKIVPLGGWVEHNIPAHTFLIKKCARRNGSRCFHFKAPPLHECRRKECARFRWTAFILTQAFAAKKMRSMFWA